MSALLASAALYGGTTLVVTVLSAVILRLTRRHGAQLLWLAALLVAASCLLTTLAGFSLLDQWAWYAMRLPGQVPLIALVMLLPLWWQQHRQAAQTPAEAVVSRSALALAMALAVGALFMSYPWLRFGSEGVWRLLASVGIIAVFLSGIAVLLRRPTGYPLLIAWWGASIVAAGVFALACNSAAHAQGVAILAAPLAGLLFGAASMRSEALRRTPWFVLSAPVIVLLLNARVRRVAASDEPEWYATLLWLAIALIAVMPWLAVWLRQVWESRERSPMILAVLMALLAMSPVFAVLPVLLEVGREAENEDSGRNWDYGQRPGSVLDHQLRV